MRSRRFAPSPLLLTSPDIGDVLCSLNQLLIASLSYVCPSPVHITGSTITDSVMGQHRALKGSSDDDIVWVKEG